MSDQLACASILRLRGEHVLDDGGVRSRSAIEAVLPGVDDREEGKEQEESHE